MDTTSLAKLGMAISQLVIMAFFATGLLEVVKDVYAWARRTVNSFANTFRTTKVVLKPEDEQISAEATKFIAFILGAWMCFALDYGALADIIQLGPKARQGQAAFLDYFATGAIIRMGAGGVFDAITALTSKLQAAKSVAAQLIETPKS